jgi:hypothetical protein
MTTTSRVLIFGDVHGMLYKVQQLEQYFSQVDKVIAVGDYIDRGPDPLGVLEYVLHIPNCIRLTGNHEKKYHRKILKGQKVHPKEIPPEKADEFADLLLKVVGPNPKPWYKDDNLCVSHAPCALYQHNWDSIPPERFMYGWTIPLKPGETGFPKRIPLEEKYPGETSLKPLTVGHIHSDRINIGTNVYCVDLCSGEIDGKLGAVIFEDSVLVDTIII